MHPTPLKYWLCLALGVAGFARLLAAPDHQVLVEAGAFTEIYDPKQGESEPWCINDHIRAATRSTGKCLMKWA
jgi:hypothetical protein